MLEKAGGCQIFCIITHVVAAARSKMGVPTIGVGQYLVVGQYLPSQQLSRHQAPFPCLSPKPAPSLQGLPTELTSLHIQNCQHDILFQGYSICEDKGSEDDRKQLLLGSSYTQQ